MVIISYKNEIHKDYNNNEKILENDLIEIDEEEKSIIRLVERKKHKIVGILYLNSKIKYGVYKDKLLYLFKPSIANYPDFLVASKYENETENKYVYIEFAEWNTYLRGNVLDYIGNVGNKDVEYNHLKYIYQLNGMKELKIEKSKLENDIEKSKLLNEEYKNKDCYQLFSIDPFGCKDIDDAFHFKVLDKNKELYEIGVHISYTWIYFKEDVEKYFNIFSKRVSTLYDYNKNINMIPKDYAENMCSLLEKNYRNVLSIIFIIENGLIINSNIGLNVGYIVKNYDYDYVNDVYNQYKEDNIKLSVKQDKLIRFIEISKLIFKNDIVEDSHKLVEYWMVYANCIMANECVKKYGNKSILRVQNVKEEDEIKVKDEELSNFLKIYNGENALYKYYSDENVESNYHNNIIEFIKEKNYYTHYTSPIRRFCDMYIHGLFTNLFEDKILMENIVENMNKVNKNMRKYKNESKKIDLIFQHIEKDEYKINSVGYIIEINVERNFVKIYFPLYGFILKSKLIEQKFKEISIINKIENKYVIKIDKDEEYIYELYEKYEIILYLFPKKYNERIICKIIRKI